MSRKLRIVLSGMPPQELWPNRKTGHHWSLGHMAKLKMMDDVYILLYEQNWNKVPMGKAHITLTFRCPNGGFDLDGALSAMKHGIDALTLGKVIVDDNATRVSYSLAWERSKKSEVEILVEDKGVNNEQDNLQRRR